MGAGNHLDDDLDLLNDRARSVSEVTAVQVSWHGVKTEDQNSLDVDGAMDYVNHYLTIRLGEARDDQNCSNWLLT